MNLKIEKAPFDDLLSGAKTCEVRNDDRFFKVGDIVHLSCVDGRTMVRTISHIQRGYGLPDGICVLSYCPNRLQRTENEIMSAIEYAMRRHPIEEEHEGDDGTWSAEITQADSLKPFVFCLLGELEVIS